MKKKTCTFSYGGTSVFSFIPQGNEKNQLSILKNNNFISFSYKI